MDRFDSLMDLCVIFGFPADEGSEKLDRSIATNNDVDDDDDDDDDGFISMLSHSESDFSLDDLKASRLTNRVNACLIFDKESPLQSQCKDSFFSFNLTGDNDEDKYFEQRSSVCSGCSVDSHTYSRVVDRWSPISATTVESTVHRQTSVIKVDFAPHTPIRHNSTSTTTLRKSDQIPRIPSRVIVNDDGVFKLDKSPQLPQRRVLATNTAFKDDSHSTHTTEFSLKEASSSSFCNALPNNHTTIVPSRSSDSVARLVHH